MRTKINRWLITAFLATVATGCMSTGSSMVERTVASFDYSPTSTSPAGSAGMKIILVNPSYADGFAQSGVQPYATFAESMGSDFEEVLIALGYTVFGPYKSYDEVVFSEKEVADLILLADIDLTQTSTLQQQQKLSLGSILIATGAPRDAQFDVSGQMAISGKLTLKAQEPQSSESMWTKSLEIAPQSFDVSSTSAWTASDIASGNFLADPGVFNPTYDALSATYADVLRKSNTYLDPRELRQLRPQIERIKNRIRY